MQTAGVDRSQLALRVLQNAPLLILILDLEGRIVHINPFLERLTGYPLDEVQGVDWFDTFAPERHRARLRALFAECCRGERGRGGVDPIVTRAGEERLIEWSNEILYEEEGQAASVLAVGQDVTERKAAQDAVEQRRLEQNRLDAEKKIAEQSRLLELIFEHSLDNIVILDKDYNFVRVSDSYARGCQMDAADLVGRNHFEVFPSSFEAELVPFREAKLTYRRAERPFVFPGHPEWGTTYWDLAMVPILDAAGEIELHLFTLRDVTDRKKAELQIASSLREKETLLREIHHRVKNNLQVIASLLHFHSKKVRAPADAATFTELRQRISAIMLVHERLYQSSDVARVDVGDYVRALVAELSRSYGPREDVHVDVTTDDVRLPIELALPCGMIVCELMTNILKHAFPDARGGAVTVSVRTAGGRVFLCVDDDGIGFPEGFDPRSGGSFGWDLVRTLVLQLDGEIEVIRNRGARVCVSFAAPSPAEEVRL